MTPTSRPEPQPTTTGSAAASDAVAFRHVDAEDPTALHRHLDAGRLQVHPAVINNGGETLTNQVRALIEAAFGARVANGYGCSEMLMIAYDCGHGWLHVHADWASLEPVDEQRRPVPVGSGRPPCC